MPTMCGTLSLANSNGASRMMTSTTENMATGCVTRGEGGMEASLLNRRL